MFFFDLVGGIKEQVCKRNMGLGWGVERQREKEMKKGGRGRIKHTQ